MKRYGSKSFWVVIIWLVSALGGTASVVAAESSEQLVAAAKKEGDEIVFVAGAQTFGGRKGFSDLEAAFNKKFGLKAKINFAAGPDMNARAARLITEAKANRQASSVLHVGSQSHFARLHEQNALETVV